MSGLGVVAKSIAALAFLNVFVQCQRIAIIGEGITGSFTAKYLSDYDEGCKLDGITIFEAVPIDGPISVDDTPSSDWQGSRVTSLKLQDGVNIELGASIAHSDFHLVVDMIRNDPTVEIGAPFTTGLEGEDSERSMGIYVGNKTWAFRTWHGWKMWNKLMLLLRYNVELIRMSSLLKQSTTNFEMLPRLLDSTEETTFFQSPDDIWDRLGFLPAVHAPFSVLLDAANIGSGSELASWRRFLPFQGSLRDELLTAINLVNYNQDIYQVNGMVGLGSFAAASGDLFSIKGGNHAVIRSAIQQARNVRSHRGCFGQIQQVHKKVTHVVGSLSGLTLFSQEEDLGLFDAVVLAAPLHQAQIQFMVQSQFDESVLQSMPLGGLVDTEKERDPAHHEGHEPLPASLPDSAQRPYTQVVTTIVSKGKIQSHVLGLDEGKPPPRSILFTVSGKASLHNITAITRIHPSGVYKLFSSDVLSDDVLKTLLGIDVQKEYVKKWGGPFGGATPDYQGKGESTKFLLYDASVGIEGHTASGALYYPQAVELSSLACMEISAVGAKSVAKLIAKRFGWIQIDKSNNEHDEL